MAKVDLEADTAAARPSQYDKASSKNARELLKMQQDLEKKHTELIPAAVL